MSQADIFGDLEIIEDVEVIGSSIFVKKLYFPYAVCVSQECDIEQDCSKRQADPARPSLLHYAVVPAFSFELFLQGKHWGRVTEMDVALPSKRSDTASKKIAANEIPRYHYLKFQETDMPELILDFKQFFTVSVEYLNKNLAKRVCSMADLYREQISHRFAYYIARVGLPE